MKFKSIIITIIFLSLIFLMIYSLENQKNENGESCLSLTFDDGHKSDYTITTPLLKDKDWKATFFITPSNYKQNVPYFTNKTEINYIIKDGHEIGSHTTSHKYLTELSDEEKYKEIVNSKSIIEKDFNISVFSIAFPYGDYNSDILTLSKIHYNNIRKKTQVIKEDTNIKKSCRIIKSAKIKNKNIVLMLHGITETDNKISEYELKIEDFKELLACIEDSEIKVDTFNNCNNI